MEPLVSILIPAFNAQALIGDALDSALAQTWGRKEIIVVDDGSKDQTLSVLKRFDSKLQVITQAHQGAAAARNRAFAASKGDYIQWLDADDLLAPDKIEKQMQLAQVCGSKKTLFSSAWGWFMYRTPKASFIPTTLWRDLVPAEWVIEKWTHNVYMQTATWLVTRELTEAAGTWDSRLLGDDDGEYFCRVVLASNGTRFSPDAKVFYRKLGLSSLSYVGLSNEKLDAQFLSMKLQIGHLRRTEDSARVRAAALNYLQSWLASFYPNRVDLVEQAQELARSLGGCLQTPRFSWKYAWIAALLGPAVAKRASILLPGLRASARRVWDKALFNLWTLIFHWFSFFNGEK
jgi:glycosyltransferase involved in cell wall biosynthesis